ncbi:MAG: nucleotidyltransferase domain-containing protein [Paludibacteraceae bacterium]|nr:nucleotidyltransferase domain-containing protein [Paludibacteraceae bacterium]
MPNEGVIKQIRQLGKQIIPQGGNLWLYGSRARGDYHANSDWDLLVLLDKDKVQWNDYDIYAYPFTELGWRLGQTINPVLYSKQEWQARHFSPFYYNVQNDKKVII